MPMLKGRGCSPEPSTARTSAPSGSAVVSANSASTSAPHEPGALLALAAAVPAPILAELLGYHDDTTNHWRRAAAGDWARYASLASSPSR